jgi:hypothetical protein
MKCFSCLICLISLPKGRCIGGMQSVFEILKIYLSSQSIMTIKEIKFEKLFEGR